MLIRIVDYVGNLGGGMRFTLELLRATMRQRPEVEFQLISYGGALDRYRMLTRDSDLPLEAIARKPANYLGSVARVGRGLRGGRRSFRLAGVGADFHYDVPHDVLDSCDVLWLPWVHRHRYGGAAYGRIVGSFHDAIFFKFQRLLLEQQLTDEHETIQRWLASAARIVVSSNATVNTMSEVFQVGSERFSVVPLSGEHAHEKVSGDVPDGWSWSREPFLICPANITAHKNHETLLEGVASWKSKYPLALTGEGTELSPWRVHGRQAALRRFARAQGFEIGRSLIPLGYVSDEIFFGLLSRAWALVMPTLAEGGGSFPVYEAMIRGVPVICSDIPVIREQIARTGGEIMWFDPHDPNDLAESLRLLDRSYAYFKGRAMRQVRDLRHRSWGDVAKDYWRIFESAAKAVE